MQLVGVGGHPFVLPLPAGCPVSLWSWPAQNVLQGWGRWVRALASDPCSVASTGPKYQEGPTGLALSLSMLPRALGLSAALPCSFVLTPQA